MEKFHQFYPPQQLFKAEPVTMNPTKKNMFATIGLTSEIYKKKTSKCARGSKRKKESRIPSSINQNTQK